MSPTPVRRSPTPMSAVLKLAPERRNLGWPASTSTTDSASAAAASSNSPVYWGGFVGNKGSILNWAAIAVVVGLLLAICAWRFATLRHRSFKGFFLPRGLVIKRLGINIAPPPPPPQQPNPALEMEMERRRRRAEERFQRRRTRGDDIGEGGQRLGGRDSLDDEDGADVESLPGYKADISAPIYLEEWSTTPAGQEAIYNAATASAADGGAATTSAAAPANTSGTTTAANEGVMTTAQYEARIRGEAAPETEAPASATSTVPPASSPATASAEVGPSSSQASQPANPAVEALRRPQPARMPSGNPPMYETAR